MNPLRIGTWNVEYAYVKRLDALRKVLESNAADIWILTETHDDLVPSRCTHFAHSGPRPKNWNSIREGSRWVSIWSKYPVIRDLSLETQDSLRTVAALIDLGTSGKLLVYGTVIPWKNDRQYEGIKNWSEHHRVIPEQCDEWLELQNAYRDVPLCVAGDFNTDLGTGSYYGTKLGIELLRKGMDACGLFCATDPTNMPKGLLPDPPIDHIALPNSWQSRTSVVSAWPRSKGVLSDHSGIIVEIR
jgi:endonuclease/exonuclease/phosphatase family metal-dependent hydrolase